MKFAKKHTSKKETRLELQKSLPETLAPHPRADCTTQPIEGNKLSLVFSLFLRLSLWRSTLVIDFYTDLQLRLSTNMETNQKASIFTLKNQIRMLPCLREYCKLKYLLPKVISKQNITINIKSYAQQSSGNPQSWIFLKPFTLCINVIR